MPNAEDFAALARSSPWRFSALHFRKRDRHGDVEAWLERPGRLRVVGPDGRETIETGVPYATSVMTVSMPESYSDGPTVPGETVEIVERLPADVVPERRADGLVARRPEDPFILWDDPMYGDYAWVAMLDPVELSHHVEIAEVTESDRNGRRTWWAEVAAAPGYEPRCGCCPLLWSEISELDEAEIGGPTVRESDPGVVYPDRYLVGLDHATGIVVSLQPLGAARRPEPERWPNTWFEVEILDVDQPGG